MRYLQYSIIWRSCHIASWLPLPALSLQLADVQDYEGAIANEADAGTAQYWRDIVHNVTEVGYGERAC